MFIAGQLIRAGIMTTIFIAIINANVAQFILKISAWWHSPCSAYIRDILLKMVIFRNGRLNIITAEGACIMRCFCAYLSVWLNFENVLLK